jgi:hypothetical protein
METDEHHSEPMVVEEKEEIKEVVAEETIQELEVEDVVETIQKIVENIELKKEEIVEDVVENIELKKEEIVEDVVENIELKKEEIVEIVDMKITEGIETPNEKPEILDVKQEELQKEENIPCFSAISFCHEEEVEEDAELVENEKQDVKWSVQCVPYTGCCYNENLDIDKEMDIIEKDNEKFNTNGDKNIIESINAPEKVSNQCGWYSGFLRSIFFQNNNR